MDAECSFLLAFCERVNIKFSICVYVASMHLYLLSFPINYSFLKIFCYATCYSQDILHSVVSSLLSELYVV